MADDFRLLPTADLKKLAKEKGIDNRGNRLLLISRIKAHQALAEGK